MNVIARTTQARTPIDAGTFQRVMGSFPAGVAVVTTRDADLRPCGLTTTALASVSLDPPLLLVCVDLASRTLPALLHARTFAVNVLEVGHSSLARHFASKVDDKFAELAWTDGASGLPILREHCVAWAECQLRTELEAGDHVILIGEVVDGWAAQDGQSLIYFQRGFGRFAAL
ncbi:MAG: flavin reductase family protein [Solirubrobacteraceae bacterium]|jgi:flavin reductase (DIM6/NTAB) family NADH-FMN oxidoreductase RutF